MAEGVETADDLRSLTGYGCDVAQGYLLSRPLPAAEFDRWRASRRSVPDQLPAPRGNGRPLSRRISRGIR